MASTPDGRIVDALMARLASLSLSPALPVAWPMMPFDPSGAGYLSPSWLPAETSSAAVGGGSRNYSGILQVSVFLPEVDADGEGIGPVVPADLAGAVAAHFPKDLIVERAGVPVRVKIEQPTVEAAVDDEPGWVHIPVSIPYRAFVAA